jgi:hypothetical protein
MCVTVQWDSGGDTAVLYTFSGQWSWDEFRAAWHEARALVSSVPHRVDSILDFGQSAGVPSGMLVKADHVLRGRLPNAGYIMLVNTSGLVNMLVTTYKAMNPKGGKLVFTTQTLAAARAKLTELREHENANPQQASHT